MTLRQAAVLALLVTTVAGCRKREPEAAPAPTDESTDVRGANDRARADSIAAAERRREADERARAAAIARARESLSDVVYFEYDSEQLTTEAERKLQSKITILRANPSLRIRVEGHADERGSTEYNLALGQRRAETVRNYLQTYGIETSRIQTLSYGEERPAVHGSSERDWALNRRAEFDITGGEVTNAPGPRS